MQYSLRLTICTIIFVAGLTPQLLAAQGTETEMGSLLVRGG